MICGLNCIKLLSVKSIHIQLSDILSKNTRVCFKYQYTFNRLIYRYNDWFMRLFILPLAIREKQKICLSLGTNRKSDFPTESVLPCYQGKYENRMNSTGALCGRPAGHKICRTLLAMMVNMSGMWTLTSARVLVEASIVRIPSRIKFFSRCLLAESEPAYPF